MIIDFLTLSYLLVRLTDTYKGKAERATRRGDPERAGGASFEILANLPKKTSQALVLRST